MATAPKVVPKIVPAGGAAAADAAPPKKSKKMLVIALVAGLVVLGGGGAAAWFFMGAKAHHAETSKAEAPKPPVYVPLETFTVNLLGDGVDQYLQTQFSLQVPDALQADAIKLYMPQVRSRILTLLSSKKATDINTAEGKKKLIDEIIAQVKLPFAPNTPPQQVTNVFFTSFIVQ